MTLAIARIAGAVLFLCAIGWIYWLTWHIQHLLNLAEALLDRDDQRLTFAENRNAAEIRALAEHLDVTFTDAEPAEDEWQPDPAPTTQPIVIPDQPATEPMHAAWNRSAAALTAADWQKQQDADFQQHLERIRGTR